VNPPKREIPKGKNINLIINTPRKPVRTSTTRAYREISEASNNKEEKEGSHERNKTRDQRVRFNSQPLGLLPYSSKIFCTVQDPEEQTPGGEVPNQIPVQRCVGFRRRLQGNQSRFSTIATSSRSQLKMLRRPELLDQPADANWRLVLVLVATTQSCVSPSLRLVLAINNLLRHAREPISGRRRVIELPCCMTAKPAFTS
jgi:hypothetical protein